LQRVDALTVAGRALQQARAQRLLQLAEAGKAECLCEAHQRGRLHVGRFGHRGHGAERHFVGPFEREAAQVLQLRRQARVRGGDRALQLLEVGR
jgi:hypothetical protein